MSPAEAECSASGKSDGGLGQKRKELAERWRDQSHDQVNEVFRSSGRCTATTTTPTALQDSGRHCKQGSQISHLGSVVPWQDGGSAHHLADGRPETLAAIFTDFISSRAEKIWPPPPPSLPVAMELAVDDITGDEVRACMSVCVCVCTHSGLEFAE